LLLIVDDLRPQLNYAYGNTHMVTPHLDKFAKGATTFHRAYAQMSVCAPSRISFLTGRRPGRCVSADYFSFAPAASAVALLIHYPHRPDEMLELSK
jgi:iduronate 2-sulfatase